MDAGDIETRKAALLALRDELDALAATNAQDRKVVELDPMAALCAGCAR